MQRAPNIRATFSCSGVVVLDAVPPGDLQTAKHLHDDLLHITDEDHIPYAHYRPIPNRIALFNTLEEVRVMCIRGFRPILHFEGHGSENDGFLIGSDAEAISWIELGEKLREINVATRNNLGVVMAACYGFYQMDAVNVEKPCPYNFLIAPVAEIEAGYIDDKMQVVYQTLFRTKSLAQALSSLNSEFLRFHAESYFCGAFVAYLKQQCRGRALVQRRERLLTRAVSEGLIKSPEQRRNFRRHLKWDIKRPELEFYRLANCFLHGQKTMKYEDIASLAGA